MAVVHSAVLQVMFKPNSLTTAPRASRTQRIRDTVTGRLLRVRVRTGTSVSVMNTLLSPGRNRADAGL